jgi:hypothetical protein
MPTVTSLSGYSLTNLGPLTTTFTAPASCSTAYDIDVASIGLNLGWVADCSYMVPDDCYPYGSAIDPINSAIQKGNPAADNVIGYQSPGLICPSGWTTAGVATKLNPTSTITSGTGFNTSGWIDPKFPEFFPQYLDVLLDALDPNETAIACCPRLLPSPLKLIFVNTGSGANFNLQFLQQHIWSLHLDASKLGLHPGHRM